MNVSNYILLLLLVPVFPMITSDFRRRKIALAWLIILAACSVTITIILYGLNILGINFIFNFAILIYMFLGVLLYVYIKNRNIASIKHYAGIGDVLFFLALTPIFEFRSFIYFLIGSCFASLAWWIIIYVVRHKKRTVPLVGISGCLLSFYVIINILI
jgi:peptidoglycan/LPS O-acetylase OafA/YrhL